MRRLATFRSLFPPTSPCEGHNDSERRFFLFDLRSTSSHTARFHYFLSPARIYFKPPWMAVHGALFVLRAEYEHVSS